MRAPSRAEAPIFRDAIGDDRRGHFVHLHSAVLFRHIHPAQAQFASLAYQVAYHGEILVLHLFDVRNDFFIRELLRGLRNELVLLAEIFWGEHFLGRSLLTQEAAATNLARRHCCKRSHIAPL